MNSRYLGHTFDIHGGGADLIFPHHENEIAQSCCAWHENYVNYWLHSGMVMINEEKMSKSLNNFFTIRDVLKSYDAETIRFFLLSAQYRSPLNYTEENLEKARSGLNRLYTTMRDAPKVDDVSLPDEDEYTKKFCEYMDDDFNTPGASSVLFDLVRSINKTEDPREASLLCKRLQQLGGGLGILQQDPQTFLKSGAGDNDDAAVIEKLIADRAQARLNKDWAAADKARDTLKAMGIELEDGPSGTTWHRV